MSSGSEIMCQTTDDRQLKREIIFFHTIEVMKRRKNMKVTSRPIDSIGLRSGSKNGKLVTAPKQFRGSLAPSVHESFHNCHFLALFSITNLPNLLASQRTSKSKTLHRRRFCSLFFLLSQVVAQDVQFYRVERTVHHICNYL